MQLTFQLTLEWFLGLYALMKSRSGPRHVRNPEADQFVLGDWIAAINETWSRRPASVLELGRLMCQARRALAYGQWSESVKKMPPPTVVDDKVRLALPVPSSVFGGFGASRWLDLRQLPRPTPRTTAWATF